MIKYEAVVLTKPDLGEEKDKEISNKIISRLNEIGNVTKIEILGVKKLAYQIKNNKQGYYAVYEFELEEGKTSKIREFEHFCRITDEIIKYIVIRKD